MTGKIGGIILVGGKSRRLGRDKALLRVDGKPALARIVEVLRPLVSEVLLVGGVHRFEHLDVRWIGDVVAPAGPLSGIITGFSAMEADWLCVVACDTPLVSQALLQRLLDARQEPCEAVVGRHSAGVEPLVALYSRSALDRLMEAHARGERALHRLLERLNTVFVDEAALREVDPELESFLNVNTPADVERLELIIRGR